MDREEKQEKNAQALTVGARKSRVSWIKVSYRASVWKKVDYSHSLHTAVEGILVDRYTHTYTDTHMHTFNKTGQDMF